METHPKHPDVAAIFARLLSELSVSANQLAAQLGTSQQAISNYVTGRNKPGGDLLAAIVTRYPAINSAWLLTGQGEPFPNGRTGAELPLRAAAKAILLRHDGVPPVAPNWKMNARLKELGALIGLDFPLTTHVGRHTFAQLALDAGVSLEVVSAMLGHKSTHVTQQHYCRIKAPRIAREMQAAGLG